MLEVEDEEGASTGAAEGTSMRVVEDEVADDEDAGNTAVIGDGAMAGEETGADDNGKGFGADGAAACTMAGSTPPGIRQRAGRPASGESGLATSRERTQLR